jgi:hypothetical protein
MADLVAGFIGFLVIITGLVVIVLMVRDKRRKYAIAKRNEPQRLRRKLRDLDTLIDSINQATTDDELDGLEQRENELCGD